MKAIPKSALAMLFIVAPALVNSEDVQDELTGAYMGGAVVTINLDTRQHTADKAARVAGDGHR